MTHRFELADATKLPLADNSVDMVFTSPPYADARTYGIGAQRGAAEWVEWMLTVIKEATRVCRGLVLVNCAGVTRDRTYWPCCEGLMWEWFKGGYGSLWRPAYWHRVGIPGSGGKQWLRSDIEYVIPFKRDTEWLAWCDNTANGHPPKWAPGGEMSHRLGSGTRVNQRGHSGRESQRMANSELVQKHATKLPTRSKAEKILLGGKPHTKRDSDCQLNGEAMRDQVYLPPAKANPGNLIKGIKVGGGLMGHAMTHENEAPFPIKLPEYFIRSHCPPGGTVLDMFCGSGSTAHAAENLGRNSIGFDIRESQIELSNRRMADVMSKTGLFNKVVA